VGGEAKRPGSPEGAKETNARHRHEPPRTFHFQNEQLCALIKPEFEKDLHAYLGGIVRQIGTRDHVHLLVRVPATYSVADIARLIRVRSFQEEFMAFLKEERDYGG
jgi:REP element-mobilizing transposase RayT